jgi:hypothetical protein
MLQSFDYFEKYEVPSFILCNPNKDALYTMGFIRDTNLKLKYNALSEFSFIVPYQVDGVVVEYFDFIEYRRLIHISGLTEDLGYFIIVGVEDENDGKIRTKKVTAYSLEFELINKKISKLSGTYQFYDAISPDDTLLGTLIQYCPGWTIGTIDASLLTLFRTFDVSDMTIYNFLMTDCERTYQCVFTFDTVAKTINAEAVSSIGLDTDIFLSHDNLVKSTTIKTITDELCTALNVYGGGDLDIHLVNPLGTNTIYDFSYFMTTDWMSQSLITALTNWDNLVNINQPIYANKLTTLITANTTLITQQSELVTLQSELEVLEGILSVQIQQGLPTNETQALINAKQTQINNKNNQIVSTQATIALITQQLTDINDVLAFYNVVNFTPEQFAELGSFIIGNTYQDANFIQTDTMTTVEIQEMSQDLYDQAKIILDRLSQAKYTFDLEAVNFVFLKDFLVFTNQLELGCVVTVEIENDTYAYPMLLEIDLQYDDPTKFNLVFGNRLRLDDSAFIYSDLFSQAITSAVSNGFNSSVWQASASQSNDFTLFMNSALDATVNNVISSANQNFIIDANGLRGRKLTSGVYDNEQIWMNNNVLAFTNNNWQTAKVALGKITVGSSTYYGLAADAVFGRLLAGNQLIIQNDSNTFTLNGSGATLTNANFTINSSNNLSRIILNPNDGIKVQTNISGTWTDKFYVDSGGNLIFTGNLTGATGTFSGSIAATSGLLGGWAIFSNGIYDNYGNYIRSNGQIKLGALTIDGSNATFNGTIYATKLVGTITEPQIATDAISTNKIKTAAVTNEKLGNISATKITSDTMSCDRLFGGTLKWGGTYNNPLVTMTGINGLASINATDAIQLSNTVSGITNSVYIDTSGVTLNTGSNKDISLFSDRNINIISTNGSFNVDVDNNIDFKIDSNSILSITNNDMDLKAPYTHLYNAFRFESGSNLSTYNDVTFYLNSRTFTFDNANTIDFGSSSLKSGGYLASTATVPFVYWNGAYYQSHMEFHNGLFTGYS